jgi:hypothetical protein
MNWDEGVGVCCWEGPSKEKIADLFEQSGTPFEKIVAVEEHVEETLA